MEFYERIMPLDTRTQPCQMQEVEAESVDVLLLLLWCGETSKLLLWK